MKRNLLMFIAFVLTNAFAVRAQTNDITFVVDLSPLNNPTAVAHIAGDFNSWTPTAMTSIGNNQFSITASMSGGWSNNGFNFLSSSEWTDAEPEFTETCSGSNASSGKSGSARWFYRGDEAGGTAITYAYVWNSCTSASPQVTTTFKLDLSNVIDTATTPENYAGYISGDFNSYSISTMTNKGNGIYESEISLDENASGNFFYLITNASDFSGKETVPASGCADGSNRSYAVGTTPSTIASMVGTCATQRDTWTGTTNTNWHTTTNWQGGVIPDQTYDITIPDVTNDPVVSSNTPAIVNGLTIAMNASLTVSNESSLVIYGDVTNNGTYSYTRNLTTPLGYSIMGSPVTNATVADLQSDFFYAYNSSNDTYETKSGSTPLVSGQGYFVAKTTAGTVDFTGTPNSHYVNYNVTDGNFELVSNPYSAAISAEKFLAGNTTALDGTLYFWDDGGVNASATTRGGDYVTVNMVGMITTGTVDLSDGVNGLKGTTPAADGFIGSAQGFFVKVQADGQASFNPSMQATDVSSNAAASYYRQESKTAYIQIKLAMEGEGLYNETILAYHESATPNHDYGLDAFKFSGNKNISFHSVSPVNAKDNYAIQVVPTDFLETKGVSLGYNLSNAGQYQLSVKDLKNIPAGYQILLQDHWNNSLQEISVNSSFAFSTEGQETSNERFELFLVKSEVLGLDAQLSKMQVQASVNGLNIEQAEEGAHELAIYTATGQLLHQGQIFIEHQSGYADVALNANQLYIVRVGNQTQKFLIKR